MNEKCKENVNFGNPNTEDNIDYGPMINKDGLNKVEKLVKSAHDISSGGMLVALAEMCIFGKIGAKIKVPQDNISPHEYLFGEDQSRYLIEVNEKSKGKTCNILKNNSIFYEIIGKTQKDSLNLDKEFNVKLSELYQLNSFWFKNYFGEH